MPNSYDFNHFEVNPTDIGISRSMFNMDHSVKFSGNVGEVIPFDVIEVLPGDTFSIDTAKVVRLQPLVTPIFDEVIMDCYWFYVPNRLVWAHWKEFCGENNQSPWAPSVEYTIPLTNPPTGGWNEGTIADYMGVPIKHRGRPVSSLPFRAYALICDQWFRSEAVMNPVNVSVGDSITAGSNGDDQVTDIEKGGKPFIACRFFDYFSGALPSPQRGEAANVSLSGLAPVIPTDKSVITAGTTVGKFNSAPSPHGLIWHSWRYNSLTDDFTEVVPNNAHSFPLYLNRAGNETAISTNPSVDQVPTNYYYPSNLWADLGNASQFTINDLRSAFAVQRYLEKSARYGGRYTEFVKGFFSVESPDARLQRTEYLGGSRLSLNISSVAQTSATQSGSTPQANVAGMSVTGDITSDVNYSATEHGYIIGCCVLRYHHSYQQGLNRMWSRRTFTDFYLPTFAFLGEQEIKNSELYYNATSYSDTGEVVNDEVFGYQERWSEYRYLPNRVAGEMRSSATTPLDMWHLGDYYVSLPTLSAAWMREDKSMLDRCLAVTSEVANQFIADFFVKTKAARPLPLYSIPGMIDHY